MESSEHTELKYAYELKKANGGLASTPSRHTLQTHKTQQFLSFFLNMKIVYPNLAERIFQLFDRTTRNYQ